jgi:ABC-2 type transport system ATP-binding protein
VLSASTPAHPAQHLTSGAPLIDIHDLRVRFGERWALDGLSLAVAAGEVVGLLGPNGAGKTTTLSVLATLLPPTTGTATVAGYAVDTHAAQVRRLLGVVPQALAIYPTLTAWENVLFFARLAGLRRRAARDAAQRVLERVGLLERRDDVVATFSGGMQRRLNLACGLLHTPRVLLLDEPTVGVDPQSRERIFTAVREQAAAGAAVLYSTHQLEEAERLCDRVALVDHGRVVAAGSPAALIERMGRSLRLALVTRAPLPSAWLDGIAGAHPVAADATSSARGTLAQVSLETLTVAPQVIERAAALGGEVLEFHLHQPDLQDVFIALTGRELRD